MASGVLFYHGVFGLIFASLNITLNALTINAFIRVKLLRLNPSNLLIIALSVADLLYGSFVLVLAAIPYAFMDSYPYGEYGCMILVAFSNVYVVGNLLLVSISIDRLLLVCVDYQRYMRIQTPLRMKQTVAICCAIGITSAVFELSLWNYAKRANVVAANINFNNNCFSPARFTRWFGLTYSFGLFCMPVLVVTIVSGVFFYLLPRKLKRTRQVGSSAANESRPVGAGTAANNQQVDKSDTTMTTGSASQHVNTSSSVPQQEVSGNGSVVPRDQSASAVNNPPREANARNDKPAGAIDTRNRYIKPAITLAALVASLGISLLPYCTYIIVGALCSSCTSTTALYTVLTIVQMNPLLDPIFYSATQRLIRDYYRKTFRNLCTR